MGRLVNQVKRLTHAYVRKGGKANRRQQAARMIAFARFCEDLGARELGQVGERHVIRYWKRLQHLSGATQYSHYRALALLWDLAGRPGRPPKPFPTGQSISSPEVGSKPDRSWVSPDDDHE